MNSGTINRAGRQMPVHAASPHGAIPCHRSADPKEIGLDFNDT
jgi:hypothetical protein